MLKNKVTILLFTILLTAACQSPLIKHLDPSNPQPVITADQSYSRSGYMDFNLKDSLKIIREESLGGLPYFSFLLYSGELIYTTHNGRLYFTSLNDFDDTRKTQLGVGIGAAPTIKGTTLFIPLNRGKKGLIAYDMLKGGSKWELTGEFSQSSPVVINNLVIHATTFGNISAYDTESGERKWKVEINDRILNNLAFAENNVVVLTQNGILRSYKPENGALNWSTKIDDAFYGSPVLSTSAIFTAGYKGSITKIDLLKGTVLSTARAKSNIYQTPALDGHSVYIAQGDGQLLALDKSTLDKQWSQQLEGPVTAAPLVSNSEIILGTASAKLYRVNKKDGNIIQVIPLEGRPRSQPSFYNDKVYIAYEPDYVAELAEVGK